ncbi:hypothetical protein HMPREF1279_02252 [Propionibacterium sp. KPL1852]|nr:hypothetical protein HMPREF1301_00128 [Propionibacterium sp. KPL2005]ERS26643.1 hypothetical protein HMPREF1297_02232 [Propionibacterium sp. KPL2000]ERS34448.1 hypothetical protein HMPREF1271_02224 [Propionibacterium sp. KPL1838]ERS64931.1 hypothetical protein HMPREF1279_02252 [Propionibacterium sp. KPL1852]
MSPSHIEIEMVEQPEQTAPDPSGLVKGPI